MRLDRSAWLTQGFIVFYLMASGSVQAQIIPDGTLGARSRVTTLNANTERIDGGAIRGSNLFHSFQEFSIGEGRGAYFANPAGVENILSRVTGRNPSNIFGTLGVLGNANLYLLNPNGIFFGPNARLDIRGSFTASTADSIVFSDRSLYSATDTQTRPLLTVAVPVGLQYGTQQAGTISNTGNLAVGQGQKLTLLGGTVTSTGQLTAPGGTVQVLGNQVALLDNARIDVSSETGGGIVLVGGDFQGKGEVPNAAQTFVGPATSINADGLTNGNGGRVIIWADKATEFYGNVGARGGNVSGNGGFVEVSGKENLVYQGTVKANAINGQAGTLLLDPADILITAGGAGGTFIGNPSGNLGQIRSADAGPTTITQNQLQDTQLAGTDIILEATNSITIQPLTGGKLTFASGNGSIRFQAGGAISMDSADTIVASGRNLEISGARISLGNIDTSSNSGDGGSVTLSATDSIITGDVISSSSALNGAGNLTNTGGAVTLEAGGSITSSFINTATAATASSGGNANGATVTIKSSGGAVTLTGIISDLLGQSVAARVININTPSTLSAAGILNARTDVAGSAGEVKIGDPKLGSVPSSITVSAISTRNLADGGDGGNITINTTGLFKATGAFSLQSGQPIAPDDPNALSLATEASGNGGVISITASGGIITAAAIASDSQGTGNGGNITFSSQNGEIKVGHINSQGKKTGGSIMLSAYGDVNTGYINTAISNSVQFADVNITSQNGSISINGVNDPPFKGSIFAHSITLNAPGSLFTAGALNASGGSSGTRSKIIIGDQKAPSSISIGVAQTRNGSGDGGDITISTTGLLEVRDAASRDGTGILAADAAVEDGFSIGTEATGNGGKINIAANGGIKTRGGIVSNSQFLGNGGDITIRSSNGVKIDAGTVDSSSIAGNAGNVAFSAGGNIRVAGIIDASSVSLGNGGDVVLNAQGDIVPNSIESIGQRGGQITLNSGGDLSIDKNDIFSVTTGQGRGGNVELSARSVNLTDARVANLTFGDGRAGDTIVKGFDSVNIINQGGSSSSEIGSPLFKILKRNAAFFGFEGSGIISTTGSLISGVRTIGNTGDISVETRRLLIQSEPGISKTSLTGISTATLQGSGGSSGNIKVTASDSINILGNNFDPFIPGVFDAETAKKTADQIQGIRTGMTSATQGSGNAGAITIKTGQLSLRQGAAITTGITNRGTGDGGDLTINAKSVDLQGQSALATATLGTSGKAGNLTVNAEDRLTLRDGALISADKVGTGLAGSVEINTGELLMTNRSRIGSSALGSGKGGDLTLTIGRSIEMKNVGDPQNATEIASNAFDDANGGNISILVGGQIRAKKGENNDIVATTDRGQGGIVKVQAGGIIDYFINLNGPRTPENELSAASTVGRNGIVDATGNATQPPPPIQPVVRQIPQVCPQGVTTRQAGKSQYVNTGHGGLPPNPEEALGSNVAQVPWVTLDTEEQNLSSAAMPRSPDTPTPKIIEEAKGWVRLPNGKVLLTSQTSTLPSNPCALRSSEQ